MKGALNFTLTPAEIEIVADRLIAGGIFVAGTFEDWGAMTCGFYAREGFYIPVPLDVNESNIRKHIVNFLTFVSTFNRNGGKK